MTVTTDRSLVRGEPYASSEAERIDHLVVARESDTQDLPMLEAMILQTLNRYPHLPGHARLVQLAAEPVSNPDVIAHETHEEGTTRAVEFEVDGTVCLYSRGTAAGNDQAGSNGFSLIIQRLLERYKPKHLYVATFSRLVRSHYFAHDIFQLLSNYRVTLHDGTGEPIQCWTAAGRLRWQVLVLFVDMEREAILARLTLGRLAAHRRKEWIQTYRSVPFGYELVDRKLAPVAGAHAAVNKTIRLLGTPGIDMVEVLRALGDIGVAPPVGQGSWGFDRNWVWDGKPYVPERFRRSPVQDDTDIDREGSDASRGDVDVEVVAQHGDVIDDDGDLTDDADERMDDETGEFSYVDADDDLPDSDIDEAFVAQHPGTPPPTRKLINEIQDVTGMAKRLSRYLDLWEHGVMTVYLKSPLDVDSYAEYPVIRDQHAPGNFGHIKLTYKPPAPPVPWASPEEFAAARAALEVRLERAENRSDTSNKRRPFVGQIGRWTADGKHYALLSPAGGGRSVYTLFSQPVTEGPRFHKNGATVKVVWKSSGKYAKNLTRILAVPATTLHTAISKAAIKGLEEGLPLAPAPEAPPSFLGGSIPRLRQNLQRAILDAENEAARMMRRADAPDALPDVADFCEQRAHEHIADAARIRAELAALDGTPAVQFPPEITIDTDLVARVLAGLQDCHGVVHKRTAVAIRDVITGLRLSRDGAVANFSFYLRLPAEDGIVLAGPIEGRVPQSLGSDQPGALSEEERALIRDERAHQVARELMTTEHTMTDLIRDHPYATGKSEALRAMDYLVSQRLTPKAARAAAAAIPLSTRRAIWALLHNEPVDPDLDPRFVDHLRHVYLVPDVIPRLGGTWMTENVTQQAIFDFVRANPRVEVSEFKQWAVEHGLGTTSTSNYVRKRDLVEPEQHRNTPTPLTWHVAQIRKDTGRAVVTLLDCPHEDCDGVVDTWAKCHENARSVLCSTCRRPPQLGAPTFPPEYLHLTVDAARRRVHEVNPVTKHDPPGFVVSIDVSRRIYEWANANDVWPNDRRAVSKRLVETYYNAIVDGRVEDVAAIRDWADKAGLDVPARGRIPRRIEEEFILAVLKRNARALADMRAWAAEQGRVVTRTSRQVTLDYVEALRGRNRNGAE